MFLVLSGGSLGLAFSSVWMGNTAACGYYEPNAVTTPSRATEDFELKVRVVSLKLKAAELRVQSNPYVSVSFSHRTTTIRKTSIKPKAVACTWNETVTWQHQNTFSMEDHLCFDVFHYNRFTPDELMGHAQIPMHRVVLNSPPHDVALTLSHGGSIVIQYEFKDKAAGHYENLAETKRKEERELEAALQRTSGDSNHPLCTHTHTHTHKLFANICSR